MKLGVYGGTFDPVHLGHLILAETVCEQLQLDQVLFIPAYQNPHKSDRTSAHPKARLEMLQFAISGNPRFRVSNMEIRRKGPSYTYETLTALRSEHPDADLTLIMGGDSLLDLPQWRELETIFSLAHIVAVNRGRQRVEVPSALDSDRISIRQMPAIDISATEIRQRCRTGKSIRYLTPRSVELYIQAQQLYVDSNAENSAT